MLASPAVRAKGEGRLGVLTVAPLSHLPPSCVLPSLWAPRRVSRPPCWAQLEPGVASSAALGGCRVGAPVEKEQQGAGLSSLRPWRMCPVTSPNPHDADKRLRRSGLWLEARVGVLRPGSCHFLCILELSSVSPAGCAVRGCDASPLPCWICYKRGQR